MTSKEGVSVIGAGGHAKVVIGMLRALGTPVLECFDDDVALAGTSVLGVPVRTPIRAVTEGAPAVFGIGKNDVRRRLASLPVQWRTFVHPTAFVDPSAALGPGTVVFAGAVVQPDVRIGVHAIVNTMASIDHDCVVGDFVHIAPGVHLAGNVRVEDGAFIGVGASAIPGRSIGAWATVGAGAAIVRDVAAASTVVGVPARQLRKRS